MQIQKAKAKLWAQFGAIGQVCAFSFLMSTSYFLMMIYVSMGPEVLVVWFFLCRGFLCVCLLAGFL